MPIVVLPTDSILYALEQANLDQVRDARLSRTQKLLGCGHDGADLLGLPMDHLFDEMARQTRRPDEGAVIFIDL